MTRTVTIEVINEKVLTLLRDLELLQLIRLHDRKSESAIINWSQRYKGAMAKQPVTEIDQQLDEMRKAWQ